MDTEGICKDCVKVEIPCPHWVRLVKDNEYHNKDTSKPEKVVILVYSCKEFVRR